MHIIVIDDIKRSKHFTVKPLHKKILGGAVMALIMVSMVSGFSIGRNTNLGKITELEALAKQQQQSIEEYRAERSGYMDAMSERMGIVHAEVMGISSRMSVLVPEDGHNEFAIDTERMFGSEFLDTSLDLLEETAAILKDRVDTLRFMAVGTSAEESATPTVQANRVSSRFGARIHPILGVARHHDGIDIPKRRGSPIPAPADGIVVFSGWRNGYGNVIEIDHGNGYVTLYAHNETNLKEVGEIVRDGDIIARVGSTGMSTSPHIHLEIRKDGRLVNPNGYLAAAL